MGPTAILASLSRLRESGEHLAEAIESSFEVFDNFLSEIIRFWQVVEVGEALVLEPEDIEAGLVARDKLVIAEFAPAAFRVLVSIPSRFALVAVLRDCST